MARGYQIEWESLALPHKGSFIKTPYGIAIVTDPYGKRSRIVVSKVRSHHYVSIRRTEIEAPSTRSGWLKVHMTSHTNPELVEFVREQFDLELEK
jgi:hypothetical protein